MMPDSAHRRRNPLTGEYVLVSPERMNRPWQGEDGTSLPRQPRPPHDAHCYLCPGNIRAGGQRNPDYAGTFVFDNDYPALSSANGEDLPTDARPELFFAEAERGCCRVVCFSPRHDLSLPEFSKSEILAVVETWTEETRSLSARDDINFVQIFENKGDMMGCSNPHPHSQIWATNLIPNEPGKELARQDEYMQQFGRPLLEDYLTEELKREQRIVLANECWVALIPYWALWPYETLVLPRRGVATLLELSGNERAELADLLKRLTTRYDNLFETSFPYSMGFHQAPFDGKEHPEWTLHAHFMPPLLRGPTVKKHMVGFEMLATPGRDISPETAAERLRSVSDARVQPLDTTSHI